MQIASLYTLSVTGPMTDNSQAHNAEQRRSGEPQPAQNPEGREKVTIQDTVSISAEAKSAAANDSSAAARSISLTDQELSQLRELQSRDTEVRSHEQAHLSAAGQYARGGASFTYQKGPDGNSYAIAGEVPIDLSAENDPRATIAKMRTVKRAALAPANPSSTDREVAAQATAKEARARQELSKENTIDLGQENSPPQTNQSKPETSPSEANSENSTTVDPLTVIRLSMYSQMANF